jgi:hypothetical protein
VRSVRMICNLRLTYALLYWKQELLSTLYWRIDKSDIQELINDVILISKFKKRFPRPDVVKETTSRRAYRERQE